MDVYTNGVWSWKPIMTIEEEYKQSFLKLYSYFKRLGVLGKLDKYSLLRTKDGYCLKRVK